MSVSSLQAVKCSTNRRDSYLLGVLQVIVKGVGAPGDVGLLVRLCVGVLGHLAGLAANQTVQIRAGLVATILNVAVCIRRCDKRHEIQTLAMVWHWVHLALKSAAPLSGLPAGHGVFIVLAIFSS